MLPGMSLALGIVARPFTTLEYVTVSTSLAATITLSALAAPGDVVLLLDRADSGSTATPAEVVPSGFTKLFSNPTSGWSHRIVISAGVVSGTSQVITGMSVASTLSKTAFIFRPDGSVGSFTLVSADHSRSDNNPGSATALAGSATPVAIALAAGSTTAGAPTLTATPAVSNTTLNSNVRVGFTLYNPGSTVVNQTADTSDNGSDNQSTALIFKVNGS